MNKKPVLSISADSAGLLLAVVVMECLFGLSIAAAARNPPVKKVTKFKIDPLYQVKCEDREEPFPQGKSILREIHQVI